MDPLVLKGLSKNNKESESILNNVPDSVILARSKIRDLIIANRKSANSLPN